MFLRAVPIRRACGTREKKAWLQLKTASFAEPTVQDGLVRINPAVAQERPVAASLFAASRVTFDHQNFFLLAASLGKNLPERIGNKRVSPKFQTRIARGGIAFVAHAIHYRDERSVGDRVRTLDGFPRVELRGPEFLFFPGVPANAGGIKDHLRALERCQPRAFGIPLVPTDLHADAAIFRIKIRKAEISRREIKLFVIERVIRDVHFAIFTEKRAIGIQYRAG